MAELPDPITALAGHQLFSTLETPDLQRLAGHMHRRRLNRGENVFFKGDDGDSLLLVAGGKVKISTTSAEGREAIINVIQPGKIFGEIALLDGGPRTADAWAVEDTELLSLGRNDLIAFLEERPGTALAMMGVLCGRLRRTTELVEDAVFLDLPQRLARRLIWMASSQPVANDNVVRLTISQEELGFVAGASRESTNRELRRWQGRGWVELGYGAIDIHDMAALKAFADGDDG